MKKKISLFFLCGIVLLGVCGCSDEETKQLSCEALKDVKYTISGGAFITNSGDVYSIDSNKLYTNGTNCKKINDDGVKIVKILDYYLYGNDGNVYTKEANSLMLLDDTNMRVPLSNLDMQIAQDDTIVYYKDDKIIKQDGKLYEYVDDNWQVFKEFDNEKIIEYSVSSPLTSFTYIKTDKAFYKYEKTNKEQCEKYADVECEYDYLKDEKMTDLYNNIAIYDGTLEGHGVYITKDGKYVRFGY